VAWNSSFSRWAVALFSATVFIDRDGIWQNLLTAVNQDYVNPQIVCPSGSCILVYVSLDQGSFSQILVHASTESDPQPAPQLAFGVLSCATAEACTEPSLAWTGSGLAVVWVDDQGDLHRSLVSTGGAAPTLQDDVVVTDGVYPRNLSLTWDSARQGLALLYSNGDGSGPRIFSRLSGAGQLYDSVVLPAVGPAGAVRAFNGAFQILYVDNGGQLWYERYGCQ
jgi:hypothetical protein